jgi:hypothetical protein
MHRVCRPLLCPVTTDAYMACLGDSTCPLQFRENHDFDERLVESMAIQCLAEAQEVTTTIAQKKGYDAKIISGLARDNAELFAAAKEKIEKMPQTLAADLNSYCAFKIKFYEATALCENGSALYAKCEETNQCGPAVKCLNEAVKLLFESAAASEKCVVVPVLLVALALLVTLHTSCTYLNRTSSRGQ